MITCREFVEFLMDYLEGDLPPAQRSAFEEHLSVCPSCVAYLKTYQQTIQLGKAAFDRPDDQLSDKVPEDLVKAVMAAKEKKD